MKSLLRAALLAGVTLVACSQPFSALPTGATGTTVPDEDFGRAKQRCEQSRVGAPKLRRLTRTQIENTIADVFPEIAGQFAGTDLPPDTNSPLGFSNDSRILTVNDDVLTKIAAAAEDAARRVTDASHIGAILPCAISNPDPDCARALVVRYGARLFRRPLTDGEIERYTSYLASVAARSDFVSAVRWTLTALIQSPNTLYRSELGDASSGGYVPGQDVHLTPYEMASALSYDYADSPPSEELLARAASGELRVAARRVELAADLIRSPRGRAVLAEFFRQWLGYAEVADKVRVGHASFDNVKASMAEATRRFIDEVVVQRRGGVRELLTAPFSVVNGALARFYGWDGVTSEDYQVTPRPPDGVGILAEGSILAGNANSQGSSPTRRGLLVLERFLCHARPIVPPNVPSLQESAPADKARTTRERYERLHATSSYCRSCHSRFDPIGFGFEHFDEIGRYRADEQGNPIDARGQFERDDPNGGRSNEIVAFDGFIDLVNELASSPEVVDCVGGLLAAYFNGEAIACSAEPERGNLAAHALGLEAFAAALAGAPQFVRREVP